MKENFFWRKFYRLEAKYDQFEMKWSWGKMLSCYGGILCISGLKLLRIHMGDFLQKL